MKTRGEKEKRIVAIEALSLFMLLCCGTVFGQKLAVKSNLLFDAACIPSGGVEAAFGTHVTVQVQGLYNPFSFGERKWKIWSVEPQVRWWPCTASLVSGESTTSSTSASGVTTLTFYPNEASFLSTGKSTFTADAVKGTLSSPLYFYVFPNGATTPTKLVIKGIWKDDAGSDASVVVYYPVIVNHSQRGTTLVSGGVTYADGADYAKDKTVEGNVQYSLGATIHSKGVTSLSQEVSPSAVSLTVSVGAWSTTSQEVIFD